MEEQKNTILKEILYSEPDCPDFARTDEQGNEWVYCYANEEQTEVAVTGWSGKATSLTIPSEVTDKGRKCTIVAIGCKTFVDCRIEHITIPNSIVAIGVGAFAQCEYLQHITIPDSVTAIGDSAFQLCTSLVSVTLPESLTEIAALTFFGCPSLESVNLPQSLTKIESQAFQDCEGLKSITIPRSVTQIEYWAFQGCEGLESIAVEEGNPIYDSRDGCNALIETATNTLLVGCKNTIIPHSITEIGNEAFWGCKIPKSIIIPNTVTKIGNGAFADCTSLESITIPASVKVIGAYAFDGCELLKTIILEGRPECKEGWLEGCHAEVIYK